MYLRKESFFHKFICHTCIIIRHILQLNDYSPPLLKFDLSFRRLRSSIFIKKIDRTSNVIIRGKSSKAFLAVTATPLSRSCRLYFLTRFSETFFLVPHLYFLPGRAIPANFRIYDGPSPREYQILTSRYFSPYFSVLNSMFIIFLNFPRFHSVFSSFLSPNFYPTGY